MKTPIQVQQSQHLSNWHMFRNAILATAAALALVSIAASSTSAQSPPELKSPLLVEQEENRTKHYQSDECQRRVAECRRHQAEQLPGQPKFRICTEGLLCGTGYPR
jgi:hypothetical protein